MSTMRAKMMIQAVERFPMDGTEVTQEILRMTAVGPNEAYPENGEDENNSYARWTPSATLEITIQNPKLFGKFSVGDAYYLDFIPAN